jgi:hypothetical protein
LEAHKQNYSDKFHPYYHYRDVKSLKEHFNELSYCAARYYIDMMFGPDSDYLPKNRSKLSLKEQVQ